MYKKILLTIDGNPDRDTATNHAIALAKSCKAQLVVMSAVKLERRLNRTASGVAVTEVNQAKANALRLIEEVVSRAREEGLRAEGLLVEMAPVAGILQAIEDEKPDLVVMAPHNSFVLGVPLSRTTRQVVRKSPIPVLLVRDQPKEEKE